jgi:hypothetical protein
MRTFHSLFTVCIFSRYKMPQHSSVTSGCLEKHLGELIDDLFYGTVAPSGPGPLHSQGFTIILRHTTLGRTPLDEWSARRRDLYLTTHITHNRQTSLSPVGFEPGVPASERPQTDALDRADNELWMIGKNNQQVLHDCGPDTARNSKGRNHNMTADQTLSVTLKAGTITWLRTRHCP